VKAVDWVIPLLVRWLSTCCGPSCISDDNWLKCANLDPLLSPPRFPICAVWGVKVPRIGSVISSSAANYSKFGLLVLWCVSSKFEARFMLKSGFGVISATLSKVETL